VQTAGDFSLRNSMSFRLWTIFYVFALVAAALATFGAWGILIAAILVAIWASVFRKPPQTVAANFLIAILIFGFLLSLILPGIDVGMREATRRNQCLNSIRQMALGVLNYESSHHKFPPAFVTSASGMPLLSWRVEVYAGMEFDIGMWPGTYFDSTKAWDDPANTKFSANAPFYFVCPSHASSGALSDYYAVVDPRTAFPGAVGRRMSEFKDGAATTILFIESNRPKANWAEPRELTFDEAVELLSRPASAEDGHPVDDGFFYKRRFGRCVAFADAHAELLRAPLSRELATALLTVDGGEDIASELNTAVEPELDYAKCYVFGLFMALSLFPALGVWWRKFHQPRSGVRA
jgi:hypothetical protein